MSKQHLKNPKCPESSWIKQLHVRGSGCGEHSVVFKEFISSVTYGPVNLGSPLTGGSSCLPVMTKLSSCGTRPAGSVSTHTVSMAGESLLQVLQSAGQGMRMPRGLQGLELCMHQLCLLSSTESAFHRSFYLFLCGWRVKPHPYPIDSRNPLPKVTVIRPLFPPF